jgi:hypothetical protein
MSIASFQLERDKRFRAAVLARNEAISNCVHDGNLVARHALRELIDIKMASLNDEFRRYFPGDDTQPPAITKEKAERL